MPDELSRDGSGGALAHAIEVGMAPGYKVSWLSRGLEGEENLVRLLGLGCAGPPLEAPTEGEDESDEVGVY